jgi:hypothetical protein
VQYLSGYDILPLSVAAIPRTLTMEAAKRALVRDADLLQLSGLRSLLSTAFAPPARFMNWAGISTRVVNLSDILDEGVLSFGLMDKEGLPRPIFVHNFAIRYVSSHTADICNFSELMCSDLYPVPSFSFLA